MTEYRLHVTLNPAVGITACEINIFLAAEGGP
jgi:hypothetical protein